MKSHYKLILPVVTGALLAACASEPKIENNFLEAYNGFSTDDMKSHIVTLSSDEFGGRLPTGKWGKLTEDYIINEFKAIGLQPTNGIYKQKVPLLNIEVTNKPSLSIPGLFFDYGENFVATSRKVREQSSLKDSELVFVGYGINAPEHNWNDYAGIDVKGKTVVMLINDPGYATQDASIFNGNAMTYYGRWSYKYEEAARQGAAGAIIIHETAPASYGWSVVKHGWSGPQFHLAESKEASVDVEMWITDGKAKELFTAAGIEFDEAKKLAMKRGFKAMNLKNKASISLTSKLTKSESHNVMATLPGTETPDEHIVYMGHWDHIGISTEDVEDKIFNGAHDNATGIAGIIEIAKAYNKLNIKPKRSITFLAVTAEEQGLLGSKYYADNPVIPFNKTVAAINMDSLNILGRFEDITVVGMGQSELEDLLAEVGKRQNRTLTQEPTPERGYYYRSDHFSFAKRGVPALSAKGGTKPRGGMTPARKELAERVGRCYHQSCDEYAEDWSMESAVEDLQLYFEMGHILSMNKAYPGWKDGSEFKLIREKSMQNQ
jgi:Zn-dependent M28 family amino/carboxypeptidase